MSNVQKVGNKDNKAFMILSALGILFVVDVHLGNSISFLWHIFPYDSFFMPMFAFVSGYFFRSRHIESWNSLFRFTVSKIQKLLLPYLGWIVFYGVLTALLRHFDILQIGIISWPDLIQNILTAGTSFSFNDPAWFVPLLFCVIIAYCVIRKIFSKFWNDYAAIAVFAGMGALAVCATHTFLHTNNLYMFLKVPFFLQFYHLGVLFRNKLEPWFDRVPALPLCLTAALINIVLLAKYGYAIEFPLCASMSGFYTNNPFLPLITSLTGIAFWLKISKCLVPVLGQNPLVNFISDNTAFIMTHHVAVKHLFLGILILLSRMGVTCFSGIDVAQYRIDAWYVYTEYPWCSVACFLFTMTVLVLSCKAFQRLKTALLPRK